MIIHPRYVWKGPGLYIDVPGPSHIQPRAALYTSQVCSKGTRAINKCTWRYVAVPEFPHRSATVYQTRPKIAIPPNEMVLVSFEAKFRGDFRSGVRI
jgi:hypothetical protein